jgi:hypothetical protein
MFRPRGYAPIKFDIVVFKPVAMNCNVMISRSRRFTRSSRQAVSGTHLAGADGPRVGEKFEVTASPGELRLLESVRLGVTTLTLPVVAPVGTLVVISDFETTVNVAAVPLKLTLVAPVRFVPRIVTAAPTLPEVGHLHPDSHPCDP